MLAPRTATLNSQGILTISVVARHSVAPKKTKSAKSRNAGGMSVLFPREQKGENIEHARQKGERKDWMQARDGHGTRFIRTSAKND